MAAMLVVLGVLLAAPGLPGVALDEGPCSVNTIPDVSTCIRCVAFGPGPCFALPVPLEDMSVPPRGVMS